MSVNDLFAQCKPYPRTLVLSSAMQSLEYCENAVKIFLIKSYPIILHFDLAQSITQATIDLYHWRFSRLMELQRVAYQVLQQLAHLQAGLLRTPPQPLADRPDHRRPLKAGDDGHCLAYRPFPPFAAFTHKATRNMGSSGRTINE